MRTTLLIADPVMTRVRLEAARRGATLSAVVEAALRAYLTPPAAKPTKLPPLPVWDSGGLLVDVADREALYQVLDAERDRALYVRERPAGPPKDRGRRR